MTLTGAIVLFAIIWFVLFLVILPRGVATQSEAGEVEPGTPPGAPAEINLARKALWTTLGAAAALAAVAAIMEFELLTLDDFDFLFPASFDAPMRPQN